MMIIRRAKCQTENLAVSGSRDSRVGSGRRSASPGPRSLPTKHHSAAAGQPEALGRSIGSPIGSKTVSPPEEAPWPPPPSNSAFKSCLPGKLHPPVFQGNL